jgi:hypothetical protein
LQVGIFAKNHTCFTLLVATHIREVLPIIAKQPSSSYYSGLVTTLALADASEVVQFKA